MAFEKSFHLENLSESSGLELPGIALFVWYVSASILWILECRTYGANICSTLESVKKRQKSSCKSEKDKCLVNPILSWQ